ncbi:pyruvate-formate lyase-activating enzyme [Desulfocapsa sulfexigens DSM 10523]|uniref:Pyruvate-formate lyase-activating enzyme n=1 Tax=Desulfocapsa sulfexigens (strain DSM 10523 / SB164P1) TaxID=1167006 RepID=M1PQP5_DESSD|nr:pyruvate-formate lyase-activating enzyme [Desulfocapsa sulfexigens DSM 10523]
MKEALLYQKESNDRVTCLLCSHNCSIANHRRGLCGVRENKGGVLYSLVYGKVIAEHIDPIEKKPLFHVLPGSRSLSIATVGCNFSCRHCQNASISQPGSFSSDAVPGVAKSPEAVVESALAAGCNSISYTYVEPTIFFEYAYDCMSLAKREGLKNCFVSNGYMSKPATELLTPVLDAINIDLKSYRNEFYKTVCGARLQPVLDSIRRMHDAGVWVEVTTLLIPGLNDSDEELRQIADFLVSIDKSIPWHVTGFFPTYKLTDRPPTSLESLEHAREIGIAQGLQYVYAGNRPGKGGENSSCPSCGFEVILRHGFFIQKNNLIQGKCPSCNSSIAGIWE